MKKILRIVVAIIVIALGISAWLTIKEQNKMKEYSTYCMDKVRAELWEYLENVHMNDSFCYDWTCVYMWGVTYEWIDYKYACKVYNKENVEFGIEPLYPEEIVVDEPVIEEEPIENETEIDGTSTNEDMPVAKMRVLEWQTEEETQAMVEEACVNMWWTWTDGSCMLEDGSYVNF